MFRVKCPKAPAKLPFSHGKCVNSTVPQQQLPLFIPSGHQTSFGRPIDVYMKSGLHIGVHWTSKRRLMPTEKYNNFFRKTIENICTFFKKFKFLNILVQFMKYYEKNVYLQLKIAYINGQSKLTITYKNKQKILKYS